MIDLKAIIIKYLSALENKSKFTAIVSDLCNCNLQEDKVMIKILGDVIDCGIVEEIKTSEERITPAEIVRFRTILEGKYGYSPRLCNNAIVQWVNALKQDKKESDEDKNNNNIESSLNVEVVQTDPIHEHHYVKMQIPGTCRERGYSFNMCSICGYKYKSDFTSMGDHKWELLESVEPTCVEVGYKKDVCKECGKERITKIDSTGHIYGQKTVVLEATCEKAGSMIQDCESCGKIKETEMPALGHDYSKWIEQIKPSCIEDGTRIRQCKRCGRTETEDIKATGHEFTSWTKSSKGKLTRYCNNCGLVETKLKNNKTLIIIVAVSLEIIFALSVIIIIK